MFDLFAEQAAGRADHVAASNETSEMTYGELARQAESMSRLLGGGPGPVVVLLAVPGGPRFTVMELAGLAAGAVVAPIPNDLTKHEARAYLDLLSPDIVVIESLESAATILSQLDEPAVVVSVAPPEPDPGIGDTLAAAGHCVLAWDEVLRGGIPPIRPRPVDLPATTAAVQFTSGSTSRPKGILLSNENLVANQNGNREFLDRFAGHSVFCPIPQFHAMGRAVVLEHLLSGSPVHLANRFFPGNDLARMQGQRCVGLLASPNYVKLGLRFGALRREHLPDLASVVLGTAPADASLVAELHQFLPDLAIHIRYGLSESVGALTRHTLTANETLATPGLVGTPVPGVEVAPGLPGLDAGEPGELRVRAGAVALGQLTARGTWTALVDDDGFLSTGDLAYRDGRGRLYVRGRLSTFLKSNGYRINPFEIEAVLRGAPGIQEAVVVGIPDPLSGERIIACVESRAGTGEPDVFDLNERCQSILSAYKVPREIRCITPLPRTPAGKPDRQRIASLVSSHQLARP